MKYPKPIATAIILLTSISLFSQSIEIIGGMNSANFYDFKGNEQSISSEYYGQRAYAIGLGYETKKLSRNTIRFTLCYDKYGGRLKASDIDYWSGQDANVMIDKSVIALGVFPLNLLLFNTLIINVGMEVSSLLYSYSHGNMREWDRSGNASIYDLKDIQYNASAYYGIRGRLTYDIPISKGFAIMPQYSFYLGLSNEFVSFPSFTKSLRHFVGIGVKAYLPRSAYSGEDVEQIINPDR